MTRRVLVTGGQGFVGKALVACALAQGLTVRVSSRRNVILADRHLEHFHTGDLSPATDWLVALQDVDTVVHCAARAHVMKDEAANPLEVFRVANFDGTMNLARQAVSERVRRFVFISSIGVNGAVTLDTPFNEDSEPAPHSPYAVSKYEAEVGLRTLAEEAGLEVVIIRPPLVYGHSAPGNFGALMRAVQSGWPLPLGAVHNRRSFVALDNLADFIINCVINPQAANQTFLVSDGQDLSTTELVQGIACAVGAPSRLLPVPVWALEVAAALLGKKDIVQRLCGNLQVDISKARRLLGWTPPVSVGEGLRRAVAGP